MVEYDVIEALTSGELAIKVNRRLSDGWKLYHEIKIVAFETAVPGSQERVTKFLFVQTLVKSEFNVDNLKVGFPNPFS
jgi:hypothetical protein